MTEPLHQGTPISDPVTGHPTPYFLQQMLLRTGATGVMAGVYAAGSFTVDESGRITDISPSGGVVQIQSLELETATATITFSTIPSEYTDLILSIQGRGDTAATTATVGMQFNGDTGSNYYSDRVNRTGSAQVAAGTYAEAGIVPAATTAAGRGGAIELTIPNSNGSVLHKQFSYTNYYTDNVTPTAQYGGGHWESIAPINSISLVLSAGNFDVGTRVTLYGRGS